MTIHGIAPAPDTMDNKNNEAVDGVVASEEISLEEQQAVLEKFDQESNTRNVTGFAKGFIKWYAIAMAVFHVYTSFFGLWATIRQRAMHLLFVMPLCYLIHDKIALFGKSFFEDEYPLNNRP